MNLRKKHLGLCTLLLISVVMAACTPTPTPAPTVDVNALYTQAAVTMVAQLTQNAPTITPTVPATNTPMPTVPPLNVLPTMGALPTLPPLATSTGVASATADKALYVTQSPSDNTSVKTNQTFNIIWRLRNTGTTTWNNQYTYRFYSATNKLPTAANGYNLTQTVAPNAEVELKVVATAPSSPGTYDTLWVITNPQGVNFAQFNLTINVIQGASSSGGVSATATGAPNQCDYDTIDHGTVGVGTTDIDVPGGQMRVYYRITDTTKPATLTLKVGDMTKSVSVTSTTKAYLDMGEASESPSVLSVTVAGNSVDIGPIGYWKSTINCN